MTMRVEWVGAERFDELGTDWDALAEQNPAGLAFSRHTDFQAWFRVVGGGRQMTVATVWDGNTLVAGLPCLLDGRRLSALSSKDSPIVRPLYRDVDALRVLWSAVLAAAPREFVVIETPLTEESAVVLRQVAREQRRLVLESNVRSSPVVETHGSWDAYRHEHKSRLERAGRRRRKLEKAGAEFHLVDVPADLDGRLHRGLELERRGWKGQAGTAILDDPTTTRFFTEVAHAFAAVGELRVSEIVLDGELLAFDLQVLSGGRLYALKTTYSEEHSALSPGTALRHAIVEKCFELGLDAHELLGSPAEWKRRFANASRPIGNVQVFRPRPATLATVTYRRWVRPRLVRVYRRFRPR